MSFKSYEGAGMIIYHKDKEGISILLEKRSDNHTWAIPGGGYSAKDRSLLETAVRETREETGINIDKADLVKTYSVPLFRYSVYASCLSYKVKPKRNWESEDIRWFNINDLPDGMNIMTKIEIKDFIKKEIGLCGLKN